MTTTRGARALATAALLLVATSACTSEPDSPSSDPAPSSKTPSPTASAPTSKPPSAEEVAAKAATETIRTYYAVRDELRQRPESSPSRLKTVAISTELAALRNLIKRERKAGLRQTGHTKIARLTVQAVSLDNSDPQRGKVPTVQIDVCYDVSDADLVDRSGKSVVSADRPATGWIRYSVANYKWRADPTGQWRVASSENVGRKPCAAS